MLEIGVIVGWLITIGAIVVFVHTVVLISESFARISRSMEEIALALRQKDSR
jgi:hypothetical protein